MGEWAPDFLASLWKASWQSAMLILLVLAGQRMLKSRIAPRWRYALWFLVVLRLALPATLPSPISLYNLLPAANWNFFGAGPASDAPDSWPRGRKATAPSVDAPSAQAIAEDATSPPSPWRWRLTPFPWMMLWALGASWLTAMLTLSHVRLWRQVCRRRPVLDGAVMNLLEDCKQEMGMRVPVTLVETEAVGSPALFGFVRPRLLLPVGLTQSFSPSELRCVFLHELGHIKRRDILTGWIMAVLQILHWFNPLVWLAFHRMRVDRELACDALALSHLHPYQHRHYGLTFLKLLERFGRSAWAPNLAGTVENHNQTKERIHMITKFKSPNHGLVPAVLCLAALGLVALTDAQPAPIEGKDLAGTWVLSGTPEHEGPIPARGGRMKSITDTHWTVTHIDPRDGTVLYHHGGTYRLQGDYYLEHVEFANTNTANLVGQSFRFAVKLEGDTLTLIGQGNPWREAWRRLPGSRPGLADTAALQGQWIGGESDANGRNQATLKVTGGTMEFHGPQDKEWYRATFSAYKTDPPQLVLAITECSVSEMVGRTAYAIYDMKDGQLTINGNPPGHPLVPNGFNAAGARRFVFRRP